MNYEPHATGGGAAIVGAGYVGLPLAVALAEEGVRVVCIDPNADKVRQLNEGRSYIADVPDEAIASLVRGGLLRATTDPAAAAGYDDVIICVPTPLTANREPDLSYIRSAGGALAAHLRPGHLVVLESTTYPGTTREVLQPLLEDTTGLRAGIDYHLAMSPERIDPGRTDFTVRSTPKVVGGLTDACADRACALYGKVAETVVRVSTPEAAELTKLLENIFRSVNIAFINEMAMLCDRLGIDIWEVVDAAATKPFGFMSFKPGPGLGGHCLPLDPFYLSWKAREVDFHTEFIELAGKVNENMPYVSRDRVGRALNAHRKAIHGSRVLLLGVAYKADVEDLRESPALKLIELLRADGADVVYHDPYVPELGAYDLSSVELTDAEIAAADCVTIVTAHSCVDHQEVAAHARTLVDLRGVTRAPLRAGVAR